MTELDAPSDVALDYVQGLLDKNFGMVIDEVKFENRGEFTKVTIVGMIPREIEFDI